jgi:hypothetical protein
MFIGADGNDTLDLKYRTPPREEFCGYKERDSSHRLHYEVLNALSCVEHLYCSTDVFSR